MNFFYSFFIKFREEKKSLSLNLFTFLLPKECSNEKITSLCHGMLSSENKKALK